MIYLKSFKLLDGDRESAIPTFIERRNIFNNYYPLHLFSSKQFEDIEFDNITIFYGGNGSGKSTLINMISQKLNAKTLNEINKGSYFDEYVKLCKYEMTYDEPLEIKLVTSDDVFDYLLDIRSINSNVNRKKEALSKEYLDYKFGRDASINDYEEIRNIYDAKKKTMSKFVRERLANNNIIENSNGESALMFWEKEIDEDSIYILDEPENSLSAENQLKLKKFIEDSVRFYNCQFIISTHSPFLLNLYDAKIYNLDDIPVRTRKWTELPNVLVYYNFFKEHDDEFRK